MYVCTMDHDLCVFAMAMMIVIMKMILNEDVDLSNIAGKTFTLSHVAL